MHGAYNSGPEQRHGSNMTSHHGDWRGPARTCTSHGPDTSRTSTSAGISDDDTETYTRLTFLETTGVRFAFFVYALRNELARVVLHARSGGIFIV
jgi:hypothetical protein